MPSTDIGLVSYSLDSRERRSFHASGAGLARRFDAVTRGDAVCLDDIPTGLLAFLREFSAHPPRNGFVLIRGIELDALPATPDTRLDRLPSQHNSAGNLLLIAEALGSLVGYADEKDGALVHEVHPVRGEETRIENTGAMKFGFHTENVHHPLRPDYLGLLCLRQDHDRTGSARLASIRETIDDLDPRTVAVLRTERFRSLYPTSFTRDRSNERPYSDPHAVIVGEDPDVFMRVNVHNTRALDDEGTDALDELAAALDRNRREVLLEPGDLVLIDNHVAAHGRSAFTPRYDGRDRWLRRCYSLRAIPERVRAMMPRPRVLPPLSQMYLSAE